MACWTKHCVMLVNYLKLAIRLLIRNPFFTFINVLSLSVGFASFILLWPYAQLELQSDRFHKNAERIGRLSTKIFRTHYVATVALNSPCMFIAINHVGDHCFRSVESSKNKSGGLTSI